ncbi:hypothetical protein C4B63_91g45 [Trypanosoma cruzi]|uniref:Uncharacterized protein n=1 Tax=Trypanosoma cruzi TaxID=5693 RepID=A0A2V2UTV3_TRYCR|nr:hypothetical protein C4B63_91g45 [Trypanosoma cruzi]
MTVGPQWQSMNGAPPSMGFHPSYPRSYITPQSPQMQTVNTPANTSTNTIIQSTATTDVSTAAMGQTALLGVPPYQQGYAQQGCFDQMCYTIPGQPGPCDGCGNQAVGSGCCCCNNGPMDPYCCGQPTTPGCMDCLTSHCEYTYCVMIFFTVLSAVGFIVVLVYADNDNLFKRFRANNTIGLQESIEKHIIKSTSCDASKLIGLAGRVCMEGNLNANTFVVQLSEWNIQRYTLYFIAMLFSIVTLLYATIVHFQRQKVGGEPKAVLGPLNNSSRQASKDLKILPRMWQMGPMQRSNKKNNNKNNNNSSSSSNNNKQQQQQQQQPLSPSLNRPIEVYGTPFYEFMRIAWFCNGCGSCLLGG